MFEKECVIPTFNFKRFSAASNFFVLCTISLTRITSSHIKVTLMNIALDVFWLAF